MLSVERSITGELIKRIPVGNPRFRSDCVEDILNDSMGGIYVPDPAPVEGFTAEGVWDLIHRARGGQATETDWHDLELNRPDLFTPLEGDTPNA